jgi:ABC-type uncharacterized transport system permease subunit
VAVLEGLLMATLRTMTPILLAGLGGVISEQAGIFNIALEGLMLFGAFFAVVGSHLAADAWLGVLTGMLASGILAAIFAVVVLRLKADVIISALGINLLASGLTTYVMKMWFGVVGSFTSERVQGLPQVVLPVIGKIPFIGPILSGHTPLVYISLILVGVIGFCLYRTTIGMNLRAVGENPEAAETAGISVLTYKTTALILTGILCGLAGAHLSLGYVTMFTEDMTAGRGFVAYTAVVFGKADPGLVLVASLLFGVAEALTFRVQRLGVPPSLVLMLPYVLTIYALLFRIRLGRRGKTEKLRLEVEGHKL